MFFQYIKSHIKRELYIINDKKIHNNVIVSMTTTPHRINHIWPTLNSILLQTCLPEKIYIWIPKKYKRFKETIDQIPKFLKNHTLIEVHFLDEDYGPATKLLPALAYLKNPDKKIIVVDDDKIYPSSTIKSFCDFSDLEPDAAITIIGSNVINNTRYFLRKTNRKRRVEILHGCGAYLVKPKFFTNEVFTYPLTLPAAFFEDDVWFSGWLKKKNINLWQIPHFSASSSAIQSLTIFYIDYFHNKFGIKIGGKKSLWLTENYGNKNFLEVYKYFNCN